MSKVVTYKEAITSYEIVLFDSDNHPRETTRKYGLKGGHIELQEFIQFHRANVLEFLAQHRPPTFNEVVAIALKTNTYCWYEEDLNRIVFGAVLAEFFVYKDRVVSAIPLYNHYFEYHEMFDMARRYLESQKEQGNE